MTFGVAAPETDLYVPLPQPDARWDPHTIHTHYFGFSVPEVALHGFLYIRWHPVLRSCLGGVCVYRGLNNLAALDIDFLDWEIGMPWPEVDGNTFTTANGLSVEFDIPGVAANLRYRSRDGAVSFDLRQEAVTPLLPRGHVIPGEELAATAVAGGTEQFMHCTGQLTLHGEVFDVDCHAARDRSWCQIRAETQGGAVPGPPIDWTPMYLGEDLIFNQISIESEDTDPAWKGVYDVPSDRPSHHFAWVIADGEVRKITTVRRDVLEYHPVLHAATRQVIEAEDETGRKYRFRGEAIALAPLPQWPNATFHESLFRWEDDDGRVGYGPSQELWFDAYQRAMKARSRPAVGARP